ncbi:galactokinase [Miniphocaeibacter halophilus]|uniref:Galactokinase n=1 Tax=Miniphocaeibacter halophilus TaxID=2931922 RepID=A0AC61MR14_9FIRM|nr:galactokinase family protein [Miniphocaeibacter halophilus]QQK08037.1 galactokinase [Miniphocaeibacter halophilus]
MLKVKEVINLIRNDKLNNDFLKLYKDEEKIKEQKERYIGALEKFESLYGNEEVEIYSVPGRTEVLGNHTDHQLGRVVAAAINLDMIAVVSKSENINIVSDEQVIEEIRIDDLDKKENEEETSESLIRGVTSRLKDLGYKIGGFKGYFTSDVLIGSGLSSSAAFEVMIGAILSGLYNNMTIPPVEIAKVGQYAETVYFGKASGLMDQCACSIGNLITIDFKDINNPLVEHLDVDFSKLNLSICIVDTKGSHADLSNEYTMISGEMKKVANVFNQDYLRMVNEEEFFKNITTVLEKCGDRATLRAIHFFNENRRVGEMVAALENYNLEEIEKLVSNSGDSSFKYLQNIYKGGSIKSQEVAVGLALSEKILGTNGVCRVHGGGFAGTIQIFVNNEFVNEYKESIEKVFGKGSCYVLKIREDGATKVL